MVTLKELGAGDHDMPIEVQLATLTAELLNAREDIKELKLEVTALKKQRTSWLVWGVMSLGAGVIGLVSYIFHSNHPG